MYVISLVLDILFLKKLICWRKCLVVGLLLYYLLLARLRGIERMIVSTFLLIIEKNIYQEFGFSPVHFSLFVHQLEQNQHCPHFVAFLLQENAHANIVACHGCLLVLLVYATWFQGSYIHSCLSFLVGSVVCFSCLFQPISVILICTVCCCRNFCDQNFPISRSCLFFLSAFFYFGTCGNISWCLASCFVFFFLFYHFF